MNLIETVRATRSILDRPTQRSVVLAAVAAVVIALFDMVAIALVLPLVTIATGGSDVSGVGALVSNLLGAAEPRAQVVTLAVTVVVLFIVKDLGAIGYTWWLTGFKVLKRVDLSTRLLSHFLGAPYTEISRRSSAEMLRTMNDAVIQFYGTTVFGLMTIVSNVANLATIAVALLLSALLPSLALALLFVVSGFVYLKIMKPRARAAGSVAAEAQSAAYRTAFAALGGIKETRLRGSGDFFVDGYRQAALRGAYASRTAGFISAVPRYLLEILFILVVGGLLVLGFGQGADVSGGVGLVALFVAAGLRALPAVTSLMGQIANLHFGSSFVGIVLSEVENERKWHSQAIEHVSPLAINSEVSVADVSFRYPGGLEPAVRNVSFVLPRGSSLAVVGGSGAGKTTLVDLLLGLHTPTEGMISVDGVNIQENLVAWQRSVGYVPQEVFLREASLAQNVAFDEADDKIDRDRLREALRLAQLQGVVDKLEYGVDTPIGERGSRLSGGQRQRIGIARAVYQQPQLLVLDEATSALDNETEHQVSQAVNEMRGDLTVVIVAHRLSTVRHVDTVVVMHEGQVEALGSFDEVRRSSPRFARMVQLGSLT